LDLGFPETDEFSTNLVEQAANGRVCGFLLIEHNKPVAYVYCRIDRDIVVYSYCGYDPEFAQFSPATVLLFLIIKWLFQHRKFKMFDLGNDGWGYKTMFATGAVKYLKVIWFPKTVSYFVLAVLHMLVLRAWSGMASLKKTSASWVGRLRSDMMRFASSRRTGPKANGADTGAIPNRVTRRTAPGPPKARPVRQG
jgi:CelD/BcsL family acetyltransferase involved in cellulose biosynthesis